MIARPMIDTECRFKGCRIFLEGMPGEQPRVGEFTTKAAGEFGNDYALMAEMALERRLAQNRREQKFPHVGRVER